MSRNKDLDTQTSSAFDEIRKQSSLELDRAQYSGGDIQALLPLFLSDIY